MQMVRTLMKTRPAFITREHMNMCGELKNRHFSKATHDWKAGIVCEVDSFNSSSKLCSQYGHKTNVRLRDRFYGPVSNVVWS